MGTQAKQATKEEIEKAWEEIKKYRGILKGKKIRELTPEERDELARQHLRDAGFKA